MRTFRDPQVDTTVLGTSALLALVLRGDGPVPAGPLEPAPARSAAAAPVGRWRSADGVVRLTVRTDGTYAGTVAGRKRAAHGTYRLDGTTMLLRDDCGLGTPVTVHDGTLEMAGHRLGRA